MAEWRRVFIKNTTTKATHVGYANMGGSLFSADPKAININNEILLVDLPDLKISQSTLGQGQINIRWRIR